MFKKEKGYMVYQPQIKKTSRSLAISVTCKNVYLKSPLLFSSLIIAFKKADWQDYMLSSRVWRVVAPRWGVDRGEMVVRFITF